MKDKDILDILINSTKRLTECEIKAIKNLMKENKELKESELDYTSIYLSGIFDERARWEKRVKEILEKYKYTKVEEADKIIKFYKEIQKLIESED